MTYTAKYQGTVLYKYSYFPDVKLIKKTKQKGSRNAKWCIASFLSKPIALSQQKVADLNVLIQTMLCTTLPLLIHLYIMQMVKI